MGNRKKILVVMGATGAGKSRLAVDVASLFRRKTRGGEVPFQFEIINADSMQVYRGLDVLTNKIPFNQQKGVPHHLLGTVDPTVEFTARQFRDLAIPLIDDIIARGRVPIIVGGTNYYIQIQSRRRSSLDPERLKKLVFIKYNKALHERFEKRRAQNNSEDFDPIRVEDLNYSSEWMTGKIGAFNEFVYGEEGLTWAEALVSQFLIDDLVDVLDERCHTHTDDKEDLLESYKERHNCLDNSSSSTNYDLLNVIDPVAAKRVHPNNHRKVNHYLSLYATSNIPPSELLQNNALWRWGQPVNFRYDCCFLWVDASLPVIDKYVDDRVDSMIKAGLLSEVYDIYSPTADYTRGVRQAIGVREFEIFFSKYISDNESVNGCDMNCNIESNFPASAVDILNFSKGDIRELLALDVEQKRTLLDDAIKNLKVNTRRLVRRQKRRINRLRTLYGWDMQYIDVTEALKGNENYWKREVVEPCISLVNDFLCDTSAADKSTVEDISSNKLDDRDLWTQYVCEACGSRILRGNHEWEQHKLGRGHRKRVSALRLKSLRSQSQEKQAK